MNKMKFEVLYFWVFVNFVKLTSGEESFCVLNGKKSVNYVSDKFISFVVDPTVLFTDLNISETAHELGKFLSPSYVRIAGFSTKYLEFSENEEDYQPNLSNESNLVYTPSFIDYLNEWFIKTNLSIIFALNDNNLIDEQFNFKNLHPFLDVLSEINANCSFQLGYESSNITFEVYKENLKKLKSTLDEFSLNKNDWKIISNDLNLYSESSFDIRNKIDELNQIVSAVFWENGQILPVKSEVDKLLTSPSKASIPIWTSLPKSENPITFSSTLNLAKQISTAAILGYEVVFRPPRLYELIRDTTNYWYIYLHKKLMGRNVLEIKPSTGFERLEKWDQIFISAHCTKNQNSFSRRGAITISIINNKTEEHLISLKLPLNVVNLKHIEVQSYILTSDNENSTFAYLNNKPLSMDLLRQNQVLIPKIRRARLTKSLTLTTPPKSIGFFVLPDARIPICIDDEDETNLIMEEIEEEENSVNQFVPKTQINSRNNDLKSTKLIDLYNQLKNELEIDEKFYGNNINKKLFIKDNFQDVSSREIEEVILKITKKMKENRERNFHKRDISRFRKNRKFINFKKNKPILNKYRNRIGRDINMKLLEQKTPKGENLRTKLEKLRLKSFLKPKKIETDYEENENESVQSNENDEDDAQDNNKSLNKFQQTLNDLLKPRVIDFSKLFNLKSTRNISSPETEENNETNQDSLKSVFEENDLNLDDSFQNDYPDFYDEFGEEVKVIDKHQNTDLTDPNKNILNSLVGKEFVINNNEEGSIKNTIKNLENYFNKVLDDRIANEENLDFLDNNEDYTQYDEDNSKIRKKRQQKQFTESDIAHYRQLMNSNIRHMRENIMKNKLKLKTSKKEQTDLSQRINRLKEAVDMVQRSNNKDDDNSLETTKGIKKIKKLNLNPVRFNNIKLNNDKLNNIKLNNDKLNNIKLNSDKLNNVKFLKSRLAQHKLNQNENDLKKKDEIDDETKELISKIKNELRNRKPRGTQYFENEYVPNIKLEDNLRKNYVPTFRDAIEYLKVHRNKRFISKDKYKKYMYSKYDDNFNGKSNEINSIDSINPMNAIVKDTEYLIPKISKESDFTLVLPTKDEISLKNTEGSSEISLKHVNMNNDTDNNRNVTTTENYPSKLVSFNVNNTENGVKKMFSTNLKGFDKMFDKIFEFLGNVKEKMRLFLKYMDD
ncbi:putative leucine-rich repeat-containing protein DDB_G0290503 [Onthophagus taurus]|uniref:putative leucine-rich repeat-containing protein DDB_G0290503 n=1 Tax=Onthophagus taurus TaxID=166361 RepID=UPI0039BEB6EC